MTKQGLKTLKDGDIVRGKLSGAAYIIIRTDGEKAIGIKTVEVSNPKEWELVSKAKKVKVASPEKVK